MKTISHFFDSFSLPTKLAGDVSFLLLFFGGSMVLSFVIGRTRLLSVILYSYVALSIVTFLPSNMTSFSPEGRAILFVAILFLLVSTGDTLVDIHISNSSSKFFSRVFLLGCLGSGLVFSMALSLLSKSFALQFLSPVVYGYFATPLARTLWMVAPLLFLFFLNKRR